MLNDIKGIWTQQDGGKDGKWLEEPNRNLSLVPTEE